MEDKYTETINTWNKVAQLYEDKFMDLELYNDSYQKFCELLINQNASILELGCGPGNITKQLLRLKPQLDILATDVSENMIAHAKKNNPTITTQQLDARKLASLQCTFNGIICGFIIPYLAKEDFEKLCKDFNTKLHKNGILYLSYVEGNYEHSGFQTSSSGDRAYFYYYDSKFIAQTLVHNNFKILNQLEVHYEKNDNTLETHSILIAQKG